MVSLDASIARAPYQSKGYSPPIFANDAPQPDMYSREKHRHKETRVKTIADYLDDIEGADTAKRARAFSELMDLTEGLVDATGQWDRIAAYMDSKDNHLRSIGGQLLCGLARSDPEGRFFACFDGIKRLTRDPLFVTARHVLQASYRIGLAGPKYRKLVLDFYEERYDDCAAERNATLIRFDILVCMRKLYDARHDPALAERAQKRIVSESLDTYRAKYRKVWKDA